MKNISNPLNLIYFCTAEKGPSGGAKIVYNHSDHINKLNIANLTSEILHIKKKKISKWNTSLKKLFKYNEIFKDATDYMEEHEVQAVAATYMAIAMRLYKTNLTDEGFLKMVRTVMESEVEPYEKPKRILN